MPALPQYYGNHLWKRCFRPARLLFMNMADAELDVQNIRTVSEADTRLISGIWKQNQGNRISVLEIEIASETEAEIRFRNIETMSGNRYRALFQ